MFKSLFLLTLSTLVGGAAPEGVRSEPRPDRKSGAVYIGEKNGLSLTVEIEVSADRDWDRTVRAMHGGHNDVEGILSARFKKTGTDEWYPYYTKVFTPLFEKLPAGNRFCVHLPDTVDMLIDFRKSGVSEIIGNTLRMEIKEDGVCLTGPGFLADWDAEKIPPPKTPVVRPPAPPVKPSAYEDL